MGWHQISTDAPLGAREGVASANDAQGQLVLFGGIDASRVYNDTWRWDQGTWQKIVTAQAPPRCLNAALATMPSGVLFTGCRSGVATVNETWQLANQRWQQLTAADLGTLATGAVAAFYDEARQEAYKMVSSIVASQPTLTMAWRPVTQQGTEETCFEQQRDDDGDGLAGCADPDCAWRCWPGCPFGTSCAQNAPHCGNGQCERAFGTEDDQLCPEDCPAL